MVLLLLTFMLLTPAVYAIDAVASFGKVNGDVQVLRDTRKIPGLSGLILVDKDVVVTNRDSKVTIIFRDGSEIRLFQNTTFVIEKSEEPEQGSRQFLHNLKLKVGSFWGKFTKGRQKSTVVTPTATIGIKGTNVALLERDDKLSVSLSSGSISVANEDETYDMAPGKLIENMEKHGSIKDKVRELPYMLEIKTDQALIKLPNPGKEEEIYFSLQMVDTKSRENISRQGDVYITLDIDKIVFPDTIKLNDRGYARVKAVVKPFQKADFKTGQVEVFAAMDGEQFLDVGAGQTTLSYKIPEQMTKTIRINVNSGEIQK